MIEHPYTFHLDIPVWVGGWVATFLPNFFFFPKPFESHRHHGTLLLNLFGMCLLRTRTFSPHNHSINTTFGKYNIDRILLFNILFIIKFPSLSHCPSYSFFVLSLGSSQGSCIAFLAMFLQFSLIQNSSLALRMFS